MSNEEKIAKLNEKYLLLSAACKEKLRSSQMESIRKSIIAPMLKLDPDRAVTMWKEMLAIVTEKMEDSFEDHHFCDSMVKAADYSIITPILMNDEELRNRVFFENRSGYVTTDYFEYLFQKNQLEFLTQLFNLSVSNRHGDNKPGENRFVIIDSLLDVAMGEADDGDLTAEKMKFLSKLVSSVRNKERRAQLDLRLMEVNELVDERKRSKDDDDDDHAHIVLTFEVTSATDNEELSDAVQVTHNPRATNKTPAVEPDEKRLHEYLNELNSLVGLDSVKTEINDLTNLVRVQQLRKQRKMKVPDISLHLVFSGNPGTGKTTVARLVGNIFNALGILSSGHVVEVDRSGLVAGYVGQTALKTQEVIKKALGGVLFIDEAYALSSSGEDSKDFGQEAIDTILKAMEDHRDDLVVIVAGYTTLMTQFINSNPGLKSRFNRYIIFEDYTGAQLFDIFNLFIRNNDYVASDELVDDMRAYFDLLFETRTEHFGNARDVRNLFEKMITKQAGRIMNMKHPTDIAIRTLTTEDFNAAIQ